MPLFQCMRRSYMTRTNARLPKISQSKTIELRRQGELLYGVAPCLAAMQAKRRRIYKIYIKPGISEKKGAAKRSSLNDIWEFAERRKIEVVRVDKNTLEMLSGKKPHQGIVMDVAPLSFKKMDISDCKLTRDMRVDNPLWLLLDEVHDPMNLGAILRCAYFLGVDRVIASAKKCCPLSATVSKASSGAMELMPVFSASNLEEFLFQAVGMGWCVLGTCGSNEISSDKVIDCSEYVVKQPTIVALGNEGYGLKSSIKNACSAFLTIRPHRTLADGFDSLNVGSASGILLHALQANRAT